ncbi:MAG: hypothetical protein J6J44_10460 [Lachnospiraceae bacterium]|nr:hypothetical protein [Lachnospiraceae bacterium]
MKKFVITVSLMLCLFTICAVAVTYTGIQKAKQESKDNSSQVTIPAEVPTKVQATPTPSPTPTPAEQGIDLYGTYDENDLMIQTLLAPRTDDIEIEIPQIEGLKDLEVQEKINQDMYNRIGILLRAYPEINYGSFYVRGNFANVLSISYHMGGGDRYDQLFLNYNLATGERLTLEDLFLKDADITQCVRRAFYDMLALRDTYDMEGNFNEMVSPDENEVYKLVKGYMNNEEQEFVFSPAEIHFYYEDYVATLSMLEEAEQIAVYSRFATEESLFVRDDIGFDNIFTCADTQYEPFQKIEYGYLEPNFWYDITIWESYLEDDFTGEKREKYLAAEEAFYASAEERIEEYREVAKNNPDKFYILLLKPNAYLLNWSGKYPNIAEFNERYDIYEMPMEVYEATYRDKLIAAYRYTYFAMAGGAYLEWEEGDGATRQMIEHSMTYNYIAGKELTELEEVFHKYSGYMDVIRSKTWDTLAWRGDYSWGEISALVDTLECRLEGSGVYVTIPSIEGFYLYVFFSEFDDSMMKIFD